MRTRLFPTLHAQLQESRGGPSPRRSGRRGALCLLHPSPVGFAGRGELTCTQAARGELTCTWAAHAAGSSQLFLRAGLSWRELWGTARGSQAPTFLPLVSLSPPGQGGQSFKARRSWPRSHSPYLFVLGPLPPATPPWRGGPWRPASPPCHSPGPLPSRGSETSGGSEPWHFPGEPRGGSRQWWFCLPGDMWQCLGHFASSQPGQGCWRWVGRGQGCGPNLLQLQDGSERGPPRPRAAVPGRGPWPVII